MSSHRASSPASNLSVRRFALSMDPLPTHWFDGNLLLTHAINAQVLMFPGLERLVVRAVRPYRGALACPEQRREVSRFIGQEVQHGHCHDQAVELLRRQGYAVDGWLRASSVVLHTFERVLPKWLRLSTAAAIEHYTACVAECWLIEGNMDRCNRRMAELLGWHAAEEIEHKAVVFDVMAAVGVRRPGRVFGMLLATVLLLALLVTATVWMVAHDPDATVERLRGECTGAGEANLRPTRFIERHMGPYLAADFHPNQRDNLHVAHAYLDQIQGRLRASAA